MLTCQHCQDRLLDHVYGLLEGDELKETIAHLEACPDCRAAHAKAKTDSKLMARAARAISQVPEFGLPGQAMPAIETPPPAVVPFTKPEKPKRSNWGRQWIAWSAAAAILVAVSLPIVWYRQSVGQYQADLAASRVTLKAAEAELAAVLAQFEPESRKAVKDVREHANLHLHVTGPKTLPPNSRGHLHIATRHPEGELAACKLNIKLADAKGAVVGNVVRIESDGQVRTEFETTAATPNSNLNLIVEATTPHGTSRMQEAIHIQGPSYVTRIDTNKALYQSGDVLFFRALVLERSTLEPPAQPVKMRVALVQNKKTVRSLDRATAAGGILAAEFAIEPNMAEGAYTLEVSPLDAAKKDVQTAVAPLEIVRQLPGIRLNQDRYARGSVVTGDVTLKAGQAVPDNIEGNFSIDGKAVPIQVRPQAAMAAPGGAGGNSDKTALKGSAKADRIVGFTTPPIPANVPPGISQLPMTLQVPDGDKKHEIRTVIPLEPSEFAVDFFPEGGDLIAGVKNRVFYRVRSKTGEPITGDGRVILLTSKNDVVDSQYHLGMGVFDFTPEVKETYSVRITTPGRIEVIAEPFATLGGIRREGVVLHVPRGVVGKQGAAICVTLRQQGGPRRLLLVAHCRGQIIDQRWVDAQPGSTHLSLESTPEARGMIRVTAYETAGELLEPIAERLVYRTSTQKLDLSFTPNGQSYRPGAMTKATVESRDESGVPVKSWILASVVDERFAAKPRSLSAHFLLLHELRGGPDMDDAQVILNDGPESTQVLERFLGTYGWRRYIPVREAAIVPAAHAGHGPTLVFSRENLPLGTLQNNYQVKIAAALAPVRAGIEKNTNAKQAEVASARASVNDLARRLADFEERVQVSVRVALGLLVAILVGVAVVLMGIGVYRLLRAHKEATPAFGSAFACLAACLGIVFAASFLGPIDHPQERDDQRNMAIAPPRPENDAVNEGLAQAAKMKDLADHAPVGEYRMPADRREMLRDRGINGLADAKKAEQAATFGTARQLVMARNRDQAERQTMENENLAKAYETATARRQIEYPFLFETGGRSDTLLWHPNLFLEAGKGEVRFNIPPGAATYRVLILGHGPHGRFGFFETRVDVP